MVSEGMAPRIINVGIRCWMGANGQIHAPVVLLLGKESAGAHWIGDLVDTRDGLDSVEKRRITFLYRESYPDRPARNLVALLTGSHLHSKNHITLKQSWCSVRDRLADRNST